MPAEQLQCHVQQRREQAGLSASELARRVGITRQGLHNIEKGLTAPNTLLAFRLARVLACRVDELFSLSAPSLTAQLVGEYEAGSRVQLARVAEKWLAFPLNGSDGLRQQADGHLSAKTPEGVEVELLCPSELPEHTAVLAGCAPSLELLTAHTAKQFPEVRIILLTVSSQLALELLAAGRAHMAGIHLWDAKTGESNVGFVQRQPLTATQIIALWTWEQGLMTAAGNPKGVHGVADLGGGHLTLMNRDSGSGSRLMLDAWLEAAHISKHSVPGYANEVSTPMLAAQAVQSGAADVAPGPRVAAQALGLDFLPVQEECFDLILPAAHQTHPAVQALLHTAKSPAFLRELKLLGGYHTAQVGQLQQVVP